MTNKDTTIKTGKVRFAYTNVFEPKSINGSAEKYSILVLIDKSDTDTIEKIRTAMDKAVELGIDKFKGVKPSALNWALKDGDEEHPNNEMYSNKMYLTPSTNFKPEIIDTHRNKMTTDEDFYSGCWGKITINFYAYNNKGNKGVGCSFNNILKLEDGDRLTTQHTAENDFADELDNDLPFN